MIKKIASLVLVFLFVTSIAAYAVEPGEGWLQNSEGPMDGKVETEVFATASNGTVDYAPGSNTPSDFNNLVYVFNADEGYEFNSISSSLRDATKRNASMDELWSNSGDDAGSTPNIAELYDLVLNVTEQTSTRLVVGVTLVRKPGTESVSVIADKEPELSATVHVTFTEKIITPDPLYAVRVSANIPGTGAVFSGYGTGFDDGEAYNVGLVSFDSSAFTFDGWSQSPSGNIPGADVEIIANFTPIPPAPTYTVSASANIPGTGATFAGTGSGFNDGDLYDVSVTSYDTDNFVFVGWDATPTGNIAGADVVLVALFEEIIPDEPTPEEPPVDDEEEFLDEETPEATPEALPETGGIPAELFSGLGFVFVGLGGFLKRKNK